MTTLPKQSLKCGRTNEWNYQENRRPIDNPRGYVLQIDYCRQIGVASVPSPPKWVRAAGFWRIDMAKCHEHSAWTQINRRIGPAIVFDGERERATYLGSTMELAPENLPDDAMAFSNESSEIGFEPADKK
jgi:hypothetical protein